MRKMIYIRHPQNYWLIIYNDIFFTAFIVTSWTLWNSASYKLFFIDMSHVDIILLHCILAYVIQKMTVFCWCEVFLTMLIYSIWSFIHCIKRLHKLLHRAYPFNSPTDPYVPWSLMPPIIHNPSPCILPPGPQIITVLCLFSWSSCLSWCPQ